MMCEQTEISISRWIKNRKKQQKEILEFKSTICLEKFTRGFKGRFEQAKEWISEHEVRTIKII